MRRLDDSSSFPSLLFRDLPMELFHLRPMQLRTEMVLGVVPVVKPEQIVDLFVRTHTPGNGFVRVPAEMQIVAVQVGKTVPKIIKRQEKQDEFPIQNAQENEETDKRHDLEDTPIRVRPVLSFDFRKNSLGVVAHVTEKDVAPDVFRFAIVSMSVNRQPVYGIAIIIRPVAVPHVMPVMHVFVECLGEPERERLHQTEYSIQGAPFEIGVVQEIVRDPIDVPGDADRVDDPHAHQRPPGNHGEKHEKGQNVREVQKSAKGRHSIPL